MPASASASSSSASTSAAVGACTMLTMSCSSSVSRVEPFGSSRSLAKIWVPTAAPSTEISMYSGMWVASASSEIWLFSVTTMASLTTSPVTCTGTSTVTFSPLRTATKSTCSMKPLIGSAWTCLVSASWTVPSMSMLSTALDPPCLRASIVSWPGRVRWIGSLPWP